MRPLPWTGRTSQPREPKTVCVIGGGVSGLATAALLAADGWQVDLVERSERPGGRAGLWEHDGYRFVYLLPFSPTRLFVEDTYYSDTPELDRAAIRERIGDYARTKGWTVGNPLREEHGVLPVVLGGDFEAYWRSTGKVAKAGGRAGMFHPTTGYSLPDAVRFAHLIANANDLSGAGLHELTHAHAAQAWRARKFYRMLDLMLFKAAEPAERYRVLERFYRLRPGLVSRFYAGRSTTLDKMRVLAGKPPVPIGRAIHALKDAS